MAGVATVLKPRGVACAFSSHSISLCFVIVLLLGIPTVHSQFNLAVSENEAKVLVDDTKLLQLVQIGQHTTSLQLAATIQHPDILQLVPMTISIPGASAPDPSAIATFDITAYGKSPGHSDVTFEATPAGIVNIDRLFFRITVMHSHTLYVISSIMGWVYFLAWSVSFYPQIYINYRRKSVVGLNFDFLALNLMGFTMYSLFNCGLYFSKTMQSEYFARFPRGLNPVQLNDVFFSLHAAFATMITITQCVLYERATQRVSTTARCILGVFFAVIIVSASVCLADKLHWIDFLYYCSYIKLTITFIKYVPQAVMNYRRKSTVGWSIGNILLDFTGGMLSILQMVVNAYNYDDWVSFLGDFTKFGLGMFSLCFDILFILQHYVFYREGKEFVRVNGSDGSELSTSSEGREYILVHSWDARYILLPGTSTEGSTSPEDPTPDGDYKPTSEEPYQGAPA